MRVIAGSARGRRLFSPKGSRVRPTSDRVKEALFNIVTAMIGTLSGCAVLDLFAGSGNLGIEALSRGADLAVFVDNHRDSAALVERNLQLTGFADRARVMRQDAMAAIRSLEGSDRLFQLVLIDPPYQGELLEEALNFLASSRLLDGNSLVVAEFSPREGLATVFGPLREIDRRSYGDTALAFFTISDRGSP